MEVSLLFDTFDAIHERTAATRKDINKIQEKFKCNLTIKGLSHDLIKQSTRAFLKKLSFSSDKIIGSFFPFIYKIFR